MLKSSSILRPSHTLKYLSNVRERKDSLDFEEHVNPIYKKGFQHGYWLQLGGAKEEVDKLIYGSRHHMGYSSGLIAGKKEADQQVYRDCMRELDKEQEHNKDQGYEIG